MSTEYADYWDGQPADIRNVTEVGGLLVVTDTPENVALMWIALDALQRASASTPDVTLGIKTAPAGASGRVFVIFYFNLCPLLKRLEFPAGTIDKPADAAQVEQIISDIQRLIRFTAGPARWFQREKTMVEVCGKLFMISPPPENQDHARQLLEKLEQAADAKDLSPMSLDPAVTQNPSPSAMRTVFFNVRRELLALQSRRSTVPINDQMREFVLSRVGREKWDYSGGGDIYQLGSVLAITQTPQNMQAVQRALEELSGGFPPNDKR